MTDPKILAYDLEFKNPLPDGNWKRMTECGVSVLASWSSEEHEPRVWIPEEGEDVWRLFAQHALDHEVFLTWNGLGCDDRMIHAEFALWEEVLKLGKRLDLCAVAGIFGLAQRKGLRELPIVDVLTRGVPNNYPELVGYKPGAKVNVMKGWGLDPTYGATFGAGSTKSMDGAFAPIKWQAGQKGEVIGYCVGDAYRLLRLWKHAWEGNPLRNKDGVEVVIPKAVLG